MTLENFEKLRESISRLDNDEVRRLLESNPDFRLDFGWPNPPCFIFKDVNLNVKTLRQSPFLFCFDQVFVQLGIVHKLHYGTREEGLRGLYNNRTKALVLKILTLSRRGSNFVHNIPTYTQER